MPRKHELKHPSISAENACFFKHGEHNSLDSVFLKIIFCSHGSQDTTAMQSSGASQHDVGCALTKQIFM